MALSMKEKPAACIDAAWPQWVMQDFERNQMNGCVGTTLLSEDGRVRVWDIRLSPASASASIATCSTISGPR